MKRILVILTICLLFALDSTAQERKPWIVRSVNKLGTLIDTMANKIDHSYIEVPKRPWQIVLKFNANDMNLRSESHIDELSRVWDSSANINMESKLRPNFSTSIGAWIGYRGYGLGYSLSLSGNNGSNFSIGATGSNYGINFRSRSYTTREMEVSLYGKIMDKEIYVSDDECQVYDDIDVNTMFIDGYYLFNGKHFSYAAAYDQSVIQRRSAGSFIVGAMWIYSSIDYSKPRNAMVIQCMNNIGCIQSHEGSIGAGYAYNWVPANNLLISVLAIPMVSLFNRVKGDMYTSNYDIFLDNKTPLTFTEKKPYPEDSEEWFDDVKLTYVDSKVKYGKISWNIDARVSITYNWNRYFFNIYGQWYHSRNSIDDNEMKLNDWYVNASMGIRL